MSPAQKTTALNNAETIYSSIVDYLDAFLHDSSYYQKSEADAKFYGPGNDGTGSGLVAEFFHGMTAQQLIDAGFPAGGICAWANSEASIPAGFTLANGLNSTPDLRNRIPVAAGGNYALGATGGANTVTTTGTVTIAGHTLTAAEIPKHTHGSIYDYYAITGNTAGELWGSLPSYEMPTTYDTGRNTSDTGDGGSHTHIASWAGTASQDKRPPHMALCWICKS